MADIDVVSKQGGKGWLMWLLLAIAVIAIIWVMMAGDDDGVRQVSQRIVVDAPAASQLL